MHSSRPAPILLLSMLLLAVGIACAALSRLASPTEINPASFLTQVSVQNAGTPSSPLAGNWTATFESGKVTFTIAPDGSKVALLSLNLDGWTCGGTTLTTTMQVVGTDWAIENNAFSVNIDLNPPHIEELAFNGAYDEATRTWSGTWEGDEYGTHCTGTWQTSEHQ